MKRVVVRYGDQEYSIVDRELADVEREISDAIAGARGHWLTVNLGEGRYSETRILITAGVPIGLSAIFAEGDSQEPAERAQPDEVSPTEVSSGNRDEFEVASGA